MSAPLDLENHQPKRKKILFLKGIQLQVVLLVAGALTILLLFTGFHGLFVAERSLPPDCWQTVRSVLQSSTWRLFTVGTIYVLVVALASIFISHRLVGPAYRLEEEVKRMAESPDSAHKLKVREGDELEGLVKAINTLIEKAKRTI